MRAYISVSFGRRAELDGSIQAIINVLSALGIEPFVFVDHYKFRPGEEKEMMAKAFHEIEISDILIAEVSDKGIGIGIEVGYAKAKGKSIIYVRNASAEYSTTVGGSCDFKFEYRDAGEIAGSLFPIMHGIASTKI